MNKIVILLLCIGVCVLFCASSIAESVSLTATVPNEHNITFTLGANGAIQYNDDLISESVSITVARFTPAQFTIAPEFGYKLDSIRVSSDENLQFDGASIQISSAVEDMFVELSFAEMEWEEPVYTWSEDLKTVTATCVSKDDPTVKKAETVDVLETVATEPSCTSMGITKYTADFTISPFTVQTKEIENIAMLPHALITLPAVPADAHTNGKTKSIVCSVCHEVFLESQAIDHKKQFHVPQQLKAIENEAFEGIDAHQIILSESVTSIGEKAFANCQHLGIIYIPESVKEIALDAFAGDEIITLQVKENSYAHQFALSNKIDCITK